MYIAYYDEAGDDGLPGSTPIFVLSCLYVHSLNWKDIYQKIHNFRVQLKQDFGLPVKLEFHTKQFLLNKNPFRQFGISDNDRILAVDLFCKFISTLDIQAINVAINKTIVKSPNYKVLETALSYSVQRVENTLIRQKPDERFLIITDEGRVGVMRDTTRKIQKINFIPSKFNPTSYRQEIKLLIEDPLPKDSRESYWIQVSDLMAFVVYSYIMLTKLNGKLHNRMPHLVNEKKIIEWLESMKNILNLSASQNEKYGIVYYPTK